MIKILQNKFKENIWRFKKDQEVDNNFKKEFKKFKKRKLIRSSALFYLLCPTYLPILFFKAATCESNKG